jgi:hypothetical protein
MIQFGGIIFINVTVVGPNRMTPSLPAAQPASYTLNVTAHRRPKRQGLCAHQRVDRGAAEAGHSELRVRDLVPAPGRRWQGHSRKASASALNPAAALLDVKNGPHILNDEAAAGDGGNRANLPRTYLA